LEHIVVLSINLARYWKINDKIYHLSFARHQDVWRAIYEDIVVTL